MGRRPNAIVADFFERGAKLDDSSNRYEHTCRRCGEVFPKGRVDHLINHLLKRCQNITQDERNYVLLRTEQSVSKKQNDATMDTQSRQDVNIIPILQLPVALERQQSALDTLAEVSRRHLDYSSQRSSTYDQNAILHDAEQALAEQALWAQLQQHNMSVANEQMQSAELAMPGTNLSSDDLSPQQLQHNDLNMPNNEDAYDLQAFDTDTTMPPFSTSDFATSLQTTQDSSQKHATLDPQLAPVQGQSFQQSTTSDYAPNEQLGQSKDPKPTQLRWAAQLTNSISQDAFKTAAQVKPTRAKQRGKFTEDRRKEVQEVRKRGACIRCRMLKKPCSEGTPCKTCANVDTARLWKNNCIRTRLDAEYQSWSSEYHKTMWQRAIRELTSKSDAPQRVYVKLDFDYGQGFSAFARHMMRLTPPSVPGSVTEQIAHDSILTLDNAEDLQDKISNYCMSTVVMSNAIKTEPHNFMQTTLLEAIDLLVQEAGSQDESIKADTRACYSVANSMTRDILELWLLTACITAQPDHFSPQFVITAPGYVISALSQSTMQAQLCAAVELRCARLSKKVLNDLERRLLQRQQVSGFATFIAAIILISCIERMSAFFQALDTTQGQEADLVWALYPPGSTSKEHWKQGPSFTSLLGILLRIRGLPPTTYEDEHGNLAVVKEAPDKFVKLNGSATEDQLRTMDEERRSALAKWLAKCELNYAEAQHWTTKNEDDWYGRLMAALLLQ